MNVHSINHLCFSVSDLDRSIRFYERVFEAKLKVKGRKLAYFDLNGLWIALNQEDIDRQNNARTYTHIAFTIAEDEYESEVRRLDELEVELFTGRPRDERDKKSIYFLDPDGHMFELHTGTLDDRLAYYKADMSHMEFYDESK
ncbi:metallothiol transferase FosB [Paenibacillus sp. LHD-117]|uniref:metallothiol transferase FosB n=1 Tax=Paenibacillus sp. LHD-117 TaxID=3071412 RepID=UPI0027E0176D|nr:metallothiol transferase FosB [Paenibacillus sp. LHD-117]MDQ6421620.1 metallothiol transferase FosB [Paenibacillus sp. LHD-117]